MNVIDNRIKMTGLELRELFNENTEDKLPSAVIEMNIGSNVFIRGVVFKMTTDIQDVCKANDLLAFWRDGMINTIVDIDQLVLIRFDIFEDCVFPTERMLR